MSDDQGKGRFPLEEKVEVFIDCRSIEVYAKARGYGHFTRNDGCPMWANTSNLNYSKIG